ncbi:hypothetical protein MMC26_001926 [Xylographa opegraphella]|nr:hypothetical protein [Xylographa opegraphella]
MEAPVKPVSTSLFQVYLRLRPPPVTTASQPAQQFFSPQLNVAERFLTVEPPERDSIDGSRTHITLQPPSDSRKRAVEKFAFTKVFEEDTSQLDIFKGTGVIPLVEGVLGEGRDGLLATLGVTGSGKSHTILGSKSQRGLTQLALDLMYRSLDRKIIHPNTNPYLISSLVAADGSEAHILPAAGFLDGIYGDMLQDRNISRAATPMTVGEEKISYNTQKDRGLWNQWSILGLSTGPSTDRPEPQHKNKHTLIPKLMNNFPDNSQDNPEIPSKLPFWNSPRITRTKAKLRFGNILQDTTFIPTIPRRHIPQRPSLLPQVPDISTFVLPNSPDTDYAVVVSMYEVYNDRIFDLLALPYNPKDTRRRPLLFKSTEGSPDRKIVAGLRKIVCGSYEEALMVLETGLIERRVAGTGSNSVSSRSHGFFCVEVKKRARGGSPSLWHGAQLTIVDLAGSERARNAKTAGTTLVEAGKINESLMYLGQCLQMQSDCNDGNKVRLYTTQGERKLTKVKSSIVPFRQCKLTELLFSNSFPSSSQHASMHSHNHRNPQKAVMIVTADPIGDFNATSQILRYSALAREVTVPRIPSVASTIFSTNGNQDNSKPPSRDGERAKPLFNARDVEVLAMDVIRLGDEVEVLTVRLSEEQARRREAELGWQRAEERAEEIEREVREEYWIDMEKRVEEERRRWMGALGDEADRNDEHLDRKLEILSRGIQVHEDQPVDTEQRVSELEQENAGLLRRLAALEQELQCRSPTKAPKVKMSHDLSNSREVDDGDVLRVRPADLNQTVPSVKTPGRKIRKLTPRTPAYADENFDLLSSP